jgi:hypothetical protein
LAGNGWAAQRDRAKLNAGAVLRDPSNPSQIAQFGAMQAVAPSLKLEVVPINVRDASEIERPSRTSLAHRMAA